MRSAGAPRPSLLLLRAASGPGLRPRAAPVLAGRRGDAGLPAEPPRPSRERRAVGGRGAAGIDGGVGRGAGPAAVRAEEEERLGDAGDAGTLRDLQDNRWDAVGVRLSWISFVRVGRWRNDCGRSQRLLALNLKKAVGLGGKMQPETDPVGQQE